MILTDNKKDIIDNKIFDVIHWRERHVRGCDNDISYKQRIWVYGLVTSIFLMKSIHNEINRQ